MKIFITINGEMSTYPSLPQKRAFWIRHLWGLRPKSEVSGTCRVAYSKEYWNEFNFNGFLDFSRKIEPCLDDVLIREFSVKKRTNK